MKYLIAILLLLNAVVATANVYMHSDKNGNTVYSDTPKNDAAVKVEDFHNGTFTTTITPSNAPITDKSNPTITTSPPTSSSLPTEAQATTPSTPAVNEKIKLPYNSLSISSPADQATIQNQSTVDIEVKVNPALQEGDKIQIYLDNVPIGAPTQTTKITLSRIIRGTHQLYAVIIDQNSTILKKSESVTIYVHQASSLNRPSAS